MDSDRTPRASVIVLAEDHEDTRQLVASTLRKEGYEVVEVEDGASLDFFLSAMYGGDREHPLLILSDVRMPGLNGLDVVAHVRDWDPTVPIVLFSAYSDSSTRRRAKRLGVSAFLPKPFSMEDLRRTVLTLAPLPIDGEDDPSAAFG